MSAYYNEIDPYAAQWLRNLITAGHIAPGFVDERSIEDVTPNELRGYTQCHFFAGIGVWSHALRQAGWPDDKPVWTGSCPCQPFSAAGKGGGFDDERHLWPAFHHLIEQCKPATVIGEQVASKDAESWLDLVQVDLEALGYAFGAVPFPSASVGAPHIRDRLYWVADTTSDRREWQGSGGTIEEGRQPRSQRAGQLSDGLEGHGSAIGMADASNVRYQKRKDTHRTRDSDKQSGNFDFWGEPSGFVPPNGLADATQRGQREQRGALESGNARHVDGSGDTFGGLADTQSEGSPHGGRGSILSVSAQGSGVPPSGLADTDSDGCRSGQWDDQAARHRDTTAATGSNDRHQSAGPTNGFWRDADWLFCRDGKWRPVEPGTFPLAHGATSRVGRLRAYGNAINAQAAQTFIECLNPQEG